MAELVHDVSWDLRKSNSCGSRYPSRSRPSQISSWPFSDLWSPTCQPARSARESSSSHSSHKSSPRLLQPQNRCIRNFRRKCGRMPYESRLNSPQRELENGSTDRWNSVGPAMIGSKDSCLCAREGRRRSVPAWHLFRNRWIARSSSEPVAAPGFPLC
jgi:hypothetical protein